MCKGARPAVPSMALLLLVLARSPAAELTCKGNTYPHGDKCCHECKPGYGMQRRCDNSQDTVCTPCKPGSYNSGFIYQACRPCTQCNENSGSERKQVCTATQDTICHCKPGTQTRPGYSPGVDCIPCPSGFFSPGFNQACKPWTNCTAAGKQTQKPASNMSDAVCEDKSPSVTMAPRSTQHILALPTTTEPSPAQPTTSQRPPRVPTSSPRDPALAAIMGVGVGVGLLGLTALVLILLLHRQAWKPALVTPKPPGGNSFRTPIQEEHTDDHSVLAKV
ncbi:PREDICTED: tumor necrosis factor receptor superfamily member 4 [Elephantulus edwardii]|uniref:tumor necrosis factor receptor superfamily member 4 n=1 Tax=Elephantulus edwardii TaxID=28737 RepID=UPI0003F07D2E|nr:PREDICTED: tumor necrosis factor receptor superfamily member 4 [Elephantulus edwardii]